MENKYLVTYYSTDCNIEKIEILHRTEVFDLIQTRDSATEETKMRDYSFTVEEVGKCLIDFS